MALTLPALPVTNRHDKRRPVETRLHFHSVGPLLLLLGQAYLSSSRGSDRAAVNEGVLQVAGVATCTKLCEYTSVRMDKDSLVLSRKGCSRRI